MGLAYQNNFFLTVTVVRLLGYNHYSATPAASSFMGSAFQGFLTLKDVS